MQILVYILVLVCFLPSTVSANIYGYQDDTGAYHFTNIKPANKKYTIVIETKDPQRGPVQGLGHPWHSDEERHSLLRQAKGLLGTPYKLGGEGLGGIDCSAFVKKMFSGFDVLLPRTAREQYDIGKKITRDQLSMGDLFIHASALNKGGVRIDSLSSEFYDRRFSGATRIKPLPEGNGTVIITASK
jgi:hypothetical protein